MDSEGGWEWGLYCTIEHGSCAEYALLLQVATRLQVQVATVLKVKVATRLQVQVATVLKVKVATGLQVQFASKLQFSFKWLISIIQKKI